MKKCSMCKIEKPLEDFNVNRAKKDGLQSNCRVCWKKYYKENYYQSGNEKDRLARKNKKIRNSIQEIIREAKSVPCMDCGVSYPYFVMDFDHRNPQEKLFTIARMTGCSNIELVRTEIAKCDVVCANCHRVRTHGS